MRKLRFFIAALAAILISGCSKVEQAYNITPNTDWNKYNGSFSSNRYVELDQINKSNLDRLQVAWEYEVPSDEWFGTLKCNPLVIDGVLYGNTVNNLVALDAKTGQEIWYLDWDRYDSLDRQGSSRGLLYWEGNGEKRLFVAQAKYLYAVQAENGSLVESFGNHGRIPFNTGLGVDSTAFVRLTTPGVVYDDLIITGSFVSEFLPSAPGDIRAFSALDGKLVWSFHTIPRPGEFGYDTWPPGAHKVIGGANNWGGMSLDEERGIVYVPTGSASYDFYGANRLGKNLFANTLLALNARTGERIWHYQMVHHDLWDRDLPCAPNLITVTRDGKKIDAVAQATKHGYIFVFDRVTGEPLFEIDEVPVPQSVVPGEEAWPTQPIPRKPPAITRTQFTFDEIANWSTEVRDSVRRSLSKLKTAPFTPPDTTGIVLQPGVSGGVNWGGASVDNSTSTMILNAVELPNIIKLVNRQDEFKNLKLEGSSLYTAYCSSCHGESFQGGHYIPPLKDLEKKFDREEVEEIIEMGRGSMPAFKDIDDEQRSAIAAYLLKERYNFTKNKQRKWASYDAQSMKYTIEGFEEFELPDDLLPIKPPWGTLTAVDLSKGEIKWQVPLGTKEEFHHLGLNNTGTENTGGSVVTKSGLVFIAATDDRKFRAFDIDNGKELWSYDLKGIGEATPSIYAVDGKEYIVIAVTGGDDTGFNAKYMAFALEE